MNSDELLTQVYTELRKLAAARLAREGPGQTLDATALVHEVWLKLGVRPEFQNRAHFFAAAAESMRRILVDRARAKLALKRGGGRERVSLDALQAGTPTPDTTVAVSESLDRLAAENPQRAELVKLRFFAGMTMPEAAAALEISLATAERWWSFAKAWLLADLSGGPRGGP